MGGGVNLPDGAWGRSLIILHSEGQGGGVGLSGQGVRWCGVGRSQGTGDTCLVPVCHQLPEFLNSQGKRGTRKVLFNQYLNDSIFQVLEEGCSKLSHLLRTGTCTISK